MAWIGSATLVTDLERVGYLYWLVKFQVFKQFGFVCHLLSFTDRFSLVFREVHAFQARNLTHYVD